MSSDNTLLVEIWSDISCPWCYIGKARFGTALEAFPHREAVQVVHRSFELDPRLQVTRRTTDAEYAAKYGLTPSGALAAEENLAAIARDEGLQYLVEHRDHGNTFDLHRLLHLAESYGLHDDLLDSFYRANFASERSIFDREYQAELAVAAGLDPAEVRHVLDDVTAYAPQVRADEEEAARLGITGVPFFVIDRKYGLSGAQPAEAFTEALGRAWADHDTPAGTPAS